VPGRALRELGTATVHEVVRNPRGAEGVAPYWRSDSGARGTVAHHVPDIRARHGLVRKSAGPADHGAEQRPPAVAARACRLDVGIKALFQLVMAWRFILLTLFFVGAKSPALLPRKVILGGERGDGPDAGESVRHYRSGAIIWP
jgi:hypothetical protein